MTSISVIALCLHEPLLPSTSLTKLAWGGVGVGGEVGVGRGSTQRFTNGKEQLARS